MSFFQSQELSNVFYLSRDDLEEPLSGFAPFDFELDGARWPSVEHYFQAMKFDDMAYREKIRQAPTAKAARKLGQARFKPVRKDWQAVRETVMTRAVYIKARTHDAIAERLLETGDQVIIERSNYDYFWGCGRDGRGLNNYGKVLMNVRSKLYDERLHASG